LRSGGGTKAERPASDSSLTKPKPRGLMLTVPTIVRVALMEGAGVSTPRLFL